MNDYDFYLRDPGIRGGEWVGFPLAWKGLGGVGGLPLRPHLSWQPWILDPTNPDDPTAGHWGVLQWRYNIALIEGLVGLQGVPPGDGRTPADMWADLMDFLPLDKFDLQDLDGQTYQVKMTGYSERAIEPYDTAHPNGGMLVEIELARMS